MFLLSEAEFDCDIASPIKSFMWNSLLFGEKDWQRSKQMAFEKVDWSFLKEGEEKQTNYTHLTITDNLIYYRIHVVYDQRHFSKNSDCLGTPHHKISIVVAVDVVVDVCLTCTHTCFLLHNLN